MVDYTSEVEQLEVIKRWWKEYGTSAMIGILIAVVGGISWNRWQAHQEQVLSHASMRYEQLLTSIVNNETDSIQVRAERLIERYPHTPYAQLAALQLARQEVLQGKLASAGDRLRWLVKHGDSAALRAIARVRLARILLEENKAQEALALLEANDNKAYVAAVEEVKGDVLIALGRKEAARQAYQNALKAFPGIEVTQPILQMKLDDLTEVTPTEKK